VLPEGILRETFSSLNETRNALADLEPILIERAKNHGVPTGWKDAVEWLDALIAERPDLRDRLGETRNQFAARF
jgi:hypothetical protein